MNINEWDFETIPKYPVIVNISKRRGGKSFLTRDIVKNYFYKIRKCPNVMVISETGLFNEDYKWLPKSRITKSFNDELISGIFDRQQKLIESDKKGNNELLLILDDVVNMEDSGRNNIKLLSRLFTLSRHFAISIILNTQYIKADIFPPIMRDNTDICCIFLQSNRDTKKLIVDTWLSLGEPKEGLELLDTIPDENHRIMVIDNTKMTKEYGDFIYHYKASEVPKNYQYKFP